MIPKWVCQILKGIAVTGFLCLAPDESAQATSYHFSDCSHRPVDQRTGCYNAADLATCNGQDPAGGTSGNPWCPDPNGDGNIDFVAYISDGIAPDVASGDTINLCHDACDGDGAPGIVRPEPQFQNTSCAGNGWTVLNPRVNNVTLQNYSGELLEIYGDSNDNNRFDDGGTGEGPRGTDVECFMVNNHGGTSKSGWTLKDLILREYQTTILSFQDNSAGGVPGWTFDNITLSHTYEATWGGGANAGVGKAGTGCSVGASRLTDHGMGLRIQANSGVTTIKNSTFEHLCGVSLRIIGNQNPASSFVVEDNIFLDTPQGPNFFATDNVIIRRNYVQDTTLGIEIEDRTVNYLVEDNIVANIGQYFSNSCDENGRSSVGILVDDGNNHAPGIACYGFTKDIIIRRNLVYSSNTGSTDPCTRVNGTPGTYSQHAQMFAGIQYEAECTSIHDPEVCTGAFNCSSPTIIIENNIVYNIGTIFGGNDLTKASMIVATNYPATIRNNTIYGGRHGLNLGKGDRVGGTPAHVVINNLVSNHSTAMITVFPDVVTTEIDYNNSYGPSADSLTICSAGGVGVNCTVSSAYSCSGGTPFSSFGTGNKCAASVFVDQANSNIALRDYHLAAGDTANINAGTTFSGDCSAAGDGIECDIDKDTRVAGTFDIGADESMLPGGGFESLTTFVQVPSPCDCVTIANGSSLEGTGYTTFSPPGPQSGTNYGSYVYASCSLPLISCEGTKVTLTNLTIGRTYKITGQWATPFVGATLYIFMEGSTSSTLTCNYLASPDVAIVNHNPILARFSSGCILNQFTPVTTAWQPLFTTFTAEATSHVFYFYADNLLAPTYTGIQLDNISVRPN